MIDGLFERESGLESAHLLVVHPEGMALAGSATRVDVEQLRRRVTNLRRRARARLRPLLAAELVQRRGLGGRAGIAADSFERLHGHVELVALGIFEHEELGSHAARVHRRQAGVATDAVVFVHDRRARTQVRELLNDLRGIAVGAATAPFLAGTLTEQLFLGVDRDCGLAQRDAGGERSDGQRDARVRIEELTPGADDLRRDGVGPQQFEQQLATTGRFGGQQHASLGEAQLVGEGMQRLFAALVDAGGRCGFGPEVDDRHDRDGLRNEIDPGTSTGAGNADAAPSRMCGSAVGGGKPLVHGNADLGRIEHRMLDVVPSLLEAFDHRAPGIAQTCVVLGRQDHCGARGQVVEERRGRSKNSGR